MDLTTISPAHLSAFARIQHDLDLYEEEDDDRQNQYSHLQGYTCSFSPRAMKQAPKLMTLDDYNLVSLGYKPIMSRRLHRLTLAGITVTSSNAVCGVMALYGIAITNGGPAWATWGFLGIGLMSIVVSLCLAELASAYPTTAGVHHWVYQLGSSRRRAYMSWMVGWFTIVNAVTVTASVAFYFAAIISQLLETTHKLSQTTATLVMFHLSAMFAWQILNLFSIRGIGYISTFSTLISAMLSLTGVAASTSHLPFTVFFDYSGSGSAVYAILSSTLMASFVFCPQDSVIRMAEETHRPERPMPWMVIGSTILSLCIGLPLVIVLDYGMTKPIKGLLDDTIPSVRVLLEIMGHMTGTVFTSLILVCVFFAGFNRLAIASRVAYSFARDGVQKPCNGHATTVPSIESLWFGAINDPTDILVTTNETRPIAYRNCTVSVAKPSAKICKGRHECDRFFERLTGTPQ
ncbi:hypothetical protein BGW38_008987 [Lunasporangiospora selenospora]|uniref:Amino acid transporter n=1 Tax=Lunasporangiospora selenospora TaxID=979761 RepID=A0A9P6KGA3_9FUNG|nr:hypothetical protein BGW38_008987 [Lunasporangiospora selenospora]